jgi:L-lactate dehydrogenase complex protein LldG
VVDEKTYMTDARTEVLARVAAAIGEPPPIESIPRAYRHTGSLDREARIALFCSRVADYRADVQRLPMQDLASDLSDVCERHGCHRLVIPPGLPREWRPSGVELIEDDGLMPQELDAVDGVLTGCTVAIAETGTIVLTSGPREGRRAITLVPDIHFCVVDTEQIVELVPEAVATMGSAVAGERRPLTLVSGPSATSDIELSRVEGVHGPRTLIVLVTEESK